MKGAVALAIPLNVGQSLKVTYNKTGVINWNALSTNGFWFRCVIDPENLEIIDTDNKELSSKLLEVLQVAQTLSDKPLPVKDGCVIQTKAEFNPSYGFGTSSTLVSNLASWLDINPYLLLGDTFGGSGYDIACARSNMPILYQIKKNDILITDADFKPKFIENIYFVYLGYKQSSKNEIVKFNENCTFGQVDIDDISEISRKIITTDNLDDFEKLLSEHELIMSRILKRKTIKEERFTYYDGVVKSLGAWGGDFVMMTSKLHENEFRELMETKGFEVVYRYDQLVL